MKTRSLSLALAASLISIMSLNQMTYAASGGLIPAVKSNFYYQMGGGDDVPLPAFYNTSTIPLNAEGDVGLGFDCGAFNPIASIKNSLNQIKDSALNVEQQVLNNATGAVTEFPLYELSRADPNLYNLITNAMAGAKQDMAVSTKSCEVMQSQIAAGQNPYAHWGQISLGNRWQQEIGSAEISGDGDINQARQDVSRDAGKSGVPWVNPDSTVDSNGVQTRNAGGENQPPIQVIHDTAMSGYDVIVSDSASHLNKNNVFGDSPSELSRIFPTAKDAADWVTNVVGDETITTYNGGQKSSKPGVGLYSDIQYQTGQILPKLQALVTGSTELTIENLQTISPNGMALSPEIIRDIRKQPKVIQSIIVDKLAQNIAAINVINKARLAMRILQSGGRIPAIYSNKAAQQNIQHSISLLQQDVQDILLFVKARQTLMSNMLSTITQAGSSVDAENTAIAMPKPNAPMMTNGAIANKTNDSTTKSAW
ncbi:MAG: integrating conjugative element protein [Legionellales bacterium]|nr:integrating conjugative element protein [Legionellales bacterium]